MLGFHGIREEGPLGKFPSLEPLTASGSENNSTLLGQLQRLLSCYLGQGHHIALHDPGVLYSPFFRHFATLSQVRRPAEEWRKEHIRPYHRHSCTTQYPSIVIQMSWPNGMDTSLGARTAEGVGLSALESSSQLILRETWSHLSDFSRPPFPHLNIDTTLYTAHIHFPLAD